MLPTARLSATLLVATLSACDPSGVLAPVEPHEIAVTLGVTGGFASADYAFRVDGATGEVRGVRCEALCEFVPGEVLAVLSEAQVTQIAAVLDEAGVIGLGHRDFGQGCCDFSAIELTYERGGRSARITGTDDRLPPAVSEAVRVIAPLVQGTVPVVVSPETTAEDWPSDPYQLAEVAVDGSVLRAAVAYGGGCAAHRMDLVLWGGWLESSPVQINALISHDDGDDPCDAFIQEERAFDLRLLATAYAEAYGEAPGDPRRVVLRLPDPSPGGPGVRMIEVEL